MPLLQEAERMRPQRNRTLNSCRLSLQHLNKLQLLNHIDEEVRTLNREHNRFLLSDTNALLHKLVREGDSSFVFEKIGANIRNVMIDEFQDTSRMQWDNFRLLLLEGLSQGADSLIVGDVKQSIYRWRNGDWGILNSLGNEELKMESGESSSPLNNFPVRVETLKTNRRSETNIIRFQQPSIYGCHRPPQRTASERAERGLPTPETRLCRRSAGIAQEQGIRLCKSRLP